MRGILLRSIGAVAALLMASWAHGAVIITAVETGGNLVISGSGTLNLSGLTFAGTSDATAGALGNGNVRVGDHNPGSPQINVDKYSGLSGPSSGIVDGSGILRTSNSGIGDDFGVLWLSQQLEVPVGYVSGNFLSGSSTWLGETFATAGLYEGTYQWTWSSDSITFQVVPIPAAVWLFASALGLLGWMNRKGSAK